MPKEDFIEDLYFGDTRSYYHSFIMFNYDGKNYIFDPCLGIINTADLYFDTFKVNIKGYVSSKKIKEYFINYIENPPKKEYLNPQNSSIIEKIMWRRSS